MNESLNMEQNLQTVQRLSPRQVQFVRLLEMTAPEIDDEIRRQLDDNPALEDASNDELTAESGQEVSQDNQESVSDDPDDDPADKMAPARGNEAEDYRSWQIADDTTDIYSYLNSQLGELELPERTRHIAQYIIGNIDENGYLTRTLGAMADDISIATGEEISRDQMKEAFDTVRRLDPPGICAVDLRDCLLLQLRHIEPRDKTTDTATEIVSDYFDLFSKKHYDRLRGYLGMRDDTTFDRALELITTLNPKPGSAIAAGQSDMRSGHITPDVNVEYGDDGRFTISLNNPLPRLQIEKSFASDLPLPDKKDTSAAGARRRQAQAFIKLKRDDAEAFISALQQRSATLLNVTEAIVRLQADFFKSGDTSRLRPMILKDVSSLTGYDISVVSRATAGKYVSTPTGTYPLKTFFNEAPAEDSDTSTHKILHELQDIIDHEDKRHPLSDEAIKAQMDARGYNIARRTITKYRERLGLPVGRLRRQNI